MAIGFTSEIDSILETAQVIEVQVLSKLYDNDPEKFRAILQQMLADILQVPPNYYNMLDTSSVYIKQWCLFTGYVYFEYFRKGTDVDAAFLLIEAKINKLLDAL